MRRYRLSAQVLFTALAISIAAIPQLPGAVLQDQIESKTETPAAQEATEIAEPVFEDGQAQKVEAFSKSKDWIRHDLWVETEFDSDGNGQPDRMHVSVVRQQQTESQGLKVPVIYETSPYFAGTSSGSNDYMWNPEHELGATPPERKNPPQIPQQSNRPSISNSHVRYWVPRGFAVVHSSSPGTGLSQGCPTVGGKNESLAPKAVIDWLCGRAPGFTTPEGNETVVADWCTGKIGMTGTSYNGTLPIAAATTGVEGLEAIIPDAPNTSYYHYYRANGLVRHPGGYMGEDIDVLYNFIHSGDPKMREQCDCEVRDKEMAAGMDRLSGDYNDFWSGRDYYNQLDSYKAATLMSHGFNDWNVMPSHTIRIYQALKQKGVPVQNYFHQAGHGGPPPARMMNRWFSHYLYGIDNGVEKEPRSYIAREKVDRDQPTAYPDYPHPDAEAVTLYLNGSGLQMGTLSSDPAAAATPQTLVDDVSISGSQLARAEQSPHRLLFATPPLTQPVHLSGTSQVKIKVASSRPAANLSVWMVSLPYETSTDLNDNIITRGWADPQNHKSLRESEALQAGQFYELTFDLEPDDQIIPVGQQIGLMIFSSDRDFTLWPKPGTELTIDLSETSVTLPVVGGPQALENAVGK